MKLVCAVTCISLFFLLVQCTRLSNSFENAKNKNKDLLEIASRLLLEDKSIWRKKLGCCHLPKEMLDCECCPKTCAGRRRNRLSQQDCCNLPRFLQNCKCCPSSCVVVAERQNCCHLPKPLLNCHCCPEACQPPPLLSLPLPPQPLPPLPPPQYDCCNLPESLRNCQCCPSSCQLTPSVPFNITCCHWPENLQNCACCASSCQVEPTARPSNDCCHLLPKLRNCTCCKFACKATNTVAGEPDEETTTTITPTTDELEGTIPFTTTEATKAPNDCCHFPKDFQNCNCCKSLCEETTTSPPVATTYVPSNCCDQPEEEQKCSCCPSSCEAAGIDQPSSPVMVTITSTAKSTTTTKTKESVFNCCHLNEEFRTCKCCPRNCDAFPDLLNQDHCCNWPRNLQNCDCCPSACQSSLYDPAQTDDPSQISQRKSNSPLLPLWFPELLRHRMLHLPQHRPESYIVHPPSSRKSSAISGCSGRLNPTCYPNVDNKVDDVLLETPYAKQKYPFKSNKQVSDNNFEIELRILTDLFTPARRKGVGYRSADISLPNGIDHLETDKVMAAATKNVPVNDLLRRASSESVTDSNIRNRVLPQFPRSPGGLSTILGNLINANKLYSNTRRAASSIDGKNFLGKHLLITSSDRWLDDGNSYSPILSTLLPPKKVCTRNLMEYLLNEVNFRLARYYPVHLAAPPTQGMKQFITRIGTDSNAVGNRYINESPFDVQDFDYDREVFYPTDNELAGLEDEVESNGYAAVVGNEDIELIPLEDPPMPIPLAIKKQYYAFHPYITTWNKSDYNVKLMDEASDAIFENIPNVQKVYIAPSRDVDLRQNQEPNYDANDNLLKLYAAHPINGQNFNILDGLAKTATGVEANHGEIEFYTDEENDDRILRNSILNLKKTPLSQISYNGKPLNTLRKLNIYNAANTNYINKPYSSTVFAVSPKKHIHLNKGKLPTKTANSHILHNSNNAKYSSNNRDFSYYYDDPSFYDDYITDIHMEQVSEDSPNKADYSGMNDYSFSKSFFKRGATENPSDATINENGAINSEDNQTETRLSNSNENSSPFTDNNNKMEEVKHQNKRHTRYYPYSYESLWESKLQSQPRPIRMVKKTKPYSKKTYAGDIYQHGRDAILDEVFQNLNAFGVLQPPLRKSHLSLRYSPGEPMYSNPNFALFSNLYSYNENADYMDRLTDALLRSRLRLPKQHAQLVEPRSNTGSDIVLNYWPIAYDVGDARPFDISDVSKSVPEKDKHKVVLAPTSPSAMQATPPSISNNRESESSKNVEHKGNEDKDSTPMHSLVVLLPQVIPLSPYNFGSLFRSRMKYSLHNKVSRLCELLLGEKDNPQEILPLEGKGPIPNHNIDIPYNLDEVLDDPEIIVQPGTLYRVRRTSIEDDDDKKIDIEEKNLKPDDLYRMDFNPAKEKENEKHDIKKIIFESGSLPRVARNPPQKDEGREIEIEIEEPPLSTNSTNVEVNSKTEMYKSDGEESETEGANNGT